MSEPDALRCPGCGEPLPASLESLTGALRCERCGLEVPIPEPTAPDLAFDEPPEEQPSPDAAAEPAVDLPPMPRTLDIEHWFQDAPPSVTVPPIPEGLPTVGSEEPPTGDGAGQLAELTPVEPPVEAVATLEPASPVEPPPLPTEPPPLPAATEEPPPLPSGELVISDAPLPGVPLLPTPPLLPETATEPEVLVVEEPLPVVQPVAPVVKPIIRTGPDRPKPRATEPRTRDEEVARPKPQVGLALVVMAALLLVVAVGLAVIGYAIWSGLQTAAKPRRAEAVYDGAVMPGMLTAWPARR